MEVGYIPNGVYPGKYIGGMILFEAEGNQYEGRSPVTYRTTGPIPVNVVVVDGVLSLDVTD